MPFFSRLAIFVMAATSVVVKGQTTPIPQADIITLVRNWCDPDFDNQSTIDTYGSIEDWDTSQVTDMSLVFNSRSTCNPNISAWDTSQVTSFSRMVGACGSTNMDKRLVPF